MADNSFTKIMWALLKHQVNKLVGSEVLGAIGDEIMAIGGDKIDILLDEKTISEDLNRAAENAQEVFIGKIEDKDLEQWMISLPLTNLPSISKAITDLPSAPNESELEASIRGVIETTWRNLSHSQIDLAVAVYLKCLHEALLPLEKQTLMIIGRSVLRTEEKIDILINLVEEMQTSPVATMFSSSSVKTAQQTPKPNLRPERIYSNLLKIENYAKSVFVARTRVRGRNEIYQKLHASGANHNNEFILRSKRLISFHNLSAYPWVDLCESGSMFEYSSSEWALATDTNKKNEFIDLLNKSLETKLFPEVLFDRDEKYYFFAPTENLKDKDLSYPSLQKNTSRFVLRDMPKRLKRK